MTGIIDTQDPEFYSSVANYCVEFSNRYRGAYSKNMEMSGLFNYILETRNFDIENEKEFHQKQLKKIELQAKNEPYIPIYNEKKPQTIGNKLSGFTIQRLKMLNQNKNRLKLKNSKNGNSQFHSLMNISKDKFFNIVNKFRPKELWVKQNDKWHLNHKIY